MELCHCCAHRHGLFRSDQLIYGDPDLCFKQTVPQTALFDPTTNQGIYTHPIIHLLISAWYACVVCVSQVSQSAIMLCLMLCMHVRTE